MHLSRPLPAAAPLQVAIAIAFAARTLDLSPMFCHPKSKAQARPGPASPYLAPCASTLPPKPDPALC